MGRKLALANRGRATVNFLIKSLPAGTPDGTYHILADVVDSSGGVERDRDRADHHRREPDDALTPESGAVRRPAAEARGLGQDH